jgi:2,3-bisphosphoglycerate-independent phosphoglycerate mutase
VSTSGPPLVTLVILDGWGLAPPGPGNAVDLAHTPVFDDLARRYASTRLEASGAAVGLPDGQMGNSEVGHLTIGSGRILYQDLVRVNRAVEDGSLLESEVLLDLFRRTRARAGEVHLLGLVSNGGVHSHIDHLRALLELAEREGMRDRTWVHAFTDGRDVAPESSISDLPTLPADRVATVTGRYYAMDRDERWERTQRALDAILLRVGEEADDPVSPVRASYARGVTDEFLEPIVLRGRPRLDPDRDAAIVFNFRPDRVRQLTRRLLDARVDVVTMTRYSDDFECPVVFPEQIVTDTLAEVVSKAGLRQLHAAETEKYAHVTYFLNGGVEEPWPGERRILVPSPRDVPSYDLAPEMSAGRLPGSRRGGDAPPRRCLPRHRRPRERREASRGRRHEPAHRAHDESGAVDRQPRRYPSGRRRRSLRSRTHDARPARARTTSRDDGNVADHESVTRHQHVNCS